MMLDMKKVLITSKTLNFNITILSEHNHRIFEHLIHVDFQENEKDFLNHKFNILRF